MTAFDIVAIEELPPVHVLAVINEAFGRQETLAWHQWKHREGPWGPSIGVAAVDREGPIGVRLLLPWRFRLGDSTVLAHRATEAATVPRAQGRGVFTALNRWMMEQVTSELIFSTPNANSRGGYLKLGWKVIARVPHRWEWPARARKDGCRPTGSEGVLRTDWDKRALEWRSDPRCRHTYLSTSTGDEREAVLYYRLLVRRRLRIVAPLGAIGSQERIPGLWNAMLDQSRARIVVRPATQPILGSRTRFGWTRGESLILGWIPFGGVLATKQSAAVGTVPWSAADLEAVI